MFAPVVKSNESRHDVGRNVSEGAGDGTRVGGGVPVTEGENVGDGDGIVVG